MGTLGTVIRSSRLWDAYKTAAALPDYYYWRLRGSPMRRVPHLVKERTLQEYARRYNLRVMVESGTNMGQMIASLLPQMDAVYSIEMDAWRVERARRRFSADPRVHIVYGNSADQMPTVASDISQPCLFWLDAHNFDIETPIRAELQAIAAHPIPGMVILIDDSKWFDGRNQYPTIGWVQQFVDKNFPGYELNDAMHMLRIAPKE